MAHNKKKTIKKRVEVRVCRCLYASVKTNINIKLTFIGRIKDDKSNIEKSSTECDQCEPQESSIKEK